MSTLTTMTTLTPTELQAVAGGIAPFKPVTALWEDAYGDTQSGFEHLDWTKREHSPPEDSIFDFPGGDGRQ